MCIKEVKANVSRARELVMDEASVLLKLPHPSVCFLLGIQTTSPYYLVLNLYTINGYSISIHDFLTVSFLSETLTPKQCVVKKYHALLNMSGG